MVSSSPERKLVAVTPTGLIGGAEIVLVRLLDAARRAGWSVDAAVPDGPLADRLRHDGVRVASIPDLKLPDGPRTVAAGRAGLQAARAGRCIRRIAGDADVVVANGVLTLAAVRLARLDAPVMWMVHDVITRRDWTTLTRWCRGAVSLAVAPSEAAAQPVRALGIPTRVIQNGTPWPVVPAPSASPNPPVVGEAGALTPMKGQAVLLDAVARLPRRDVIVEMAGEAPPKDQAYAEELRRRAAEPDLAGRVRFLGRVQDVTDRMRGWTLAALPSLAPESGGLAVLEAMSLGVPVVAADHGGPAEIVDSAGLLVAPGDADALSGAIGDLLDDPELRSRSGTAGRRAVAERYTLQRQERELMAALEDVTSRPASVSWLVPDVVAGLGGTTRQTLTTARALGRRGHRVRILTRRRERGLSRREVVEGLPVERVGVPGNDAVAEKASLLFLCARLARRRRGTDVVQVVMYPDFVLSAAGAGLARRTVMVWAGLGDATETLGAARGAPSRLQRWLRRRVLARCRHLVLTSALQRELGALGFKSEIVPVPIDLTRFRPPSAVERSRARASLGLDEDEFVVVYTGQLRRLKAVDRLVDAFAGFLAGGRHGRLLIVGGASGTADACADELEAQVRDADIGHSVTFTGRVDAVVSHLWAADVFVLPSEREGLSNSLAEAMACGLACVAPEYPIGGEVLGDAGVVPPDNDPQSLLDALVALADDPSTRVSLGAAAAERARTSWSTDAVVDAYELVYAHMARGTT
ncbi:MAG TPA: glycosyltransferase family 4 protein [Acidimicrobiia bacterium]